MQFTCSRKELLQSLSIVGRAVAKHSTLPVLQTIAIEGWSEGLELSATDLALGIRQRIPAQVTVEYQTQRGLCVPAVLLTRFIQKASGEEVTGQVDYRKQALTLICGSHKAQLKGIPLSEFPSIMTFDDGLELTIPAQTLRGLIKAVVYATATDISRPVLTGVHVVLSPDGLTLEAVDGYRLAYVRHPLDGIAEPEQMLIPREAALHLAQILDGDVRMAYHRQANRVQFRTDTLDVTSQLLEGRFPDAVQLIPKQEHLCTRIHVATNDLLDVCQVAALFASDAKAVDIHMESDSITLDTTGEEGQAHKAQVAATVTTKEGAAAVSAVSMNVVYLAEALAALDGAQAEIALVDSVSPVSIRPLGLEDSVHLIMPVHRR